MKKILLCSTVMALFSFAAPQHVAAQDFGAILDWIHKLSGPEFAGPAISYTFSPESLFEETWEGVERPYFRISAALRRSSDSSPAVMPAGNKITMFSIQPTLAIPITGPLEIEVGIGLHRFGGDVDGFWAWSFPAYGQVRVPVRGRVSLRMGLGGHYWLKFAEEDFAPLVVDVERDTKEFAVGGFLGVDIRIGG